MQINSRNLPALGYTIEQALEPCNNVRGGAAILTANYAQAVQQYGAGQRALLAAISAYNTGNFWSGFRNGYVGRVTGIPSIPLSQQGATTPVARPNPYTVPPRLSGRDAGPTAPLPPNPYTATTVAYSWKDLHVRIE
jgi:type IV secretion system protein VirB1